MSEVAWGVVTAAGAGLGYGAYKAYEDDDEPKPTGVARRVSKSEAERIRRQIEKQQGK